MSGKSLLKFLRIMDEDWQLSIRTTCILKNQSKLDWMHMSCSIVIVFCHPPIFSNVLRNLKSSPPIHFLAPQRKYLCNLAINSSGLILILILILRSQDPDSYVPLLFLDYDLGEKIKLLNARHMRWLLNLIYKYHASWHWLIGQK